jgi:putative MATE family efflux protein
LNTLPAAPDSARVPAPEAATRADPRRASALLDAPILATIVRLTTPSLVLALFQTAVSIADTYFVGRLGTDALAGLALAFPLVMLLQMLSAGAMGGGISSAIARALGANQAAQARNLVVHALVIALIAGFVFTLLLLAFGPALYSLLGGRDGTLEQALRYSDVLFAGAVFVWLANTFASALRGSGNTLAPAIALVIAASVQVPFSGALTLGWGPFPQLGIRGAAIAYVIAFALSSVAMALYLWSSTLRPQRTDWRLARTRFADILRVGAISSVSALQTVLTAILLTGFVAGFGSAALAGYGVGIRLELLQVPIVFAIGQALVVLVGTNVGAGRAGRAKKIAWTGTAAAMAVCLAIGLLVALFPSAWVGIFSDDPAVLETGSLYLRIVAPTYPLFGAGLALYFASQGAGTILLPMLAGSARLLVVIAGGAIVLSLGAPLGWLFAVIALGLTTLGTLTSFAVYRTAWQR